MSDNAEAHRPLPGELESAIASPGFLEAVPRAEARRVLACSIGHRWKLSSTGEKICVERLVVSSRTSPSAVADIACRLDAEIEALSATDAEIRELIERVYPSSQGDAE